MTQYLKHSRTTKALAESMSINFSEAEKRLEAACVSIVADNSATHSVSGQTALLTALATAKKTFKHVTLVISADVPLIHSIPNAKTLCSAAEFFEAQVATEIPPTTTHSVIMGESVPGIGFTVRCWWGRWCSGVLPKWDIRPLGESWNPLAGSFAGALAIREIFANILGRRENPRESLISLWEPWQKIEDADEGPTTVYVPKDMWVVGLGHLGQGFLWNVGMLPVHGEKIILQDYQRAGVENEATGLLTNSSSIGIHKTRIASEWIERLGWNTELIERKFTDKTEVTVDDPPFVIAGLDSIIPRKSILNANFDYMIDAGVGHGPFDFELAQIRVFKKGSEPNWNNQSKAKDVDKVLATAAYEALSKIDKCGAFALAAASVAVPFVGAAIGALSLVQVLRLTAMKETHALLQIELSAPDFNSTANINASPTTNLGGVTLNFLEIKTNN